MSAELVNTLSICISVGVLAIIHVIEGYLLDKRAKRVEKTLRENTEVSSEKLDEIKETGEKVHKLVNSAMIEQKRLLATALRTIAEIASTDVNVNAARVAEKEYEDLLKQQKDMK